MHSEPSRLNPNEIQTRIARLVALYGRTAILPTQWASTVIPDPEIVELVRANGPELETARRLGTELFRALHVPISIIGAAVYLIRHNGWSDEQIRTFMDGLANGPLRDTDPRISLRRILRIHAASRYQHPDYETLAFIVKTWNLYHERRWTPIVSWFPTDGMPRILRPKVVNNAET